MRAWQQRRQIAMNNNRNSIMSSSISQGIHNSNSKMYSRCPRFRHRTTKYRGQRLWSSRPDQKQPRKSNLAPMKAQASARPPKKRQPSMQPKQVIWSLPPQLRKMLQNCSFSSNSSSSRRNGRKVRKRISSQIVSLKKRTKILRKSNAWPEKFWTTGTSSSRPSATVGMPSKCKIHQQVFLRTFIVRNRAWTDH